VKTIGAAYAEPKQMGLDTVHVILCGVDEVMGYCTMLAVFISLGRADFRG